MPITSRERLARVIDGSQAPGAFSAQLSVSARDVRLTVAGAGPVSLPVKAPQAKRMIASARPARFGRGEQTLMDLSVRDTWEITPDQVTLTGLDWDAILTEVRDELGLPARGRLRAGPHALLVYGKGQFFLPHQDSEKDDTMIGTLVVSLPSSHTGGELLIEHNGKTVVYQASATEVSVAAFYADCRHEVKPVRTGCRVTFTCNLLLDSDPAGDVPAQLAELGKPLAGLLAAADGTALADEIVTALREHSDDVLACLLPMLRAAGPEPSAPLEELARDCERRLTAITERPARADDDWSVPWPGGCGCELCGTLGEFLADRSERTLEWPLAQARRKHVKDQISSADLPVKHEIWKFGSPHTLVLTKTDELLRREAKARKDATASLEWLAAQRSVNQSMDPVRETPAVMIPGPGIRGDQSGDPDTEGPAGYANVVFGPNSEKKYVAPSGGQ